MYFNRVASFISVSIGALFRLSLPWTLLRFPFVCCQQVIELLECSSRSRTIFTTIFRHFRLNANDSNADKSTGEYLSSKFTKCCLNIDFPCYCKHAIVLVCSCVSQIDGMAAEPYRMDCMHSHYMRPQFTLNFSVHGCWLHSMRLLSVSLPHGASSS